MNIVIAGAGTFGRHLTEVLSGGGHSITVIELDPEKLKSLESELDIRTLRANCAHGSALREAGVSGCDLFVAATNIDEINLLSASVAKGVGAKECVARVHHSAYFSSTAVDYQQYLHIDSLICPEYVTAVAIAQTLRNPGALAVENFARDQIELLQIKVSDDISVLGIPLSQLTLSRGVRIATITRNEHAFIPDATSDIQKGDVVTLVGEKTELDTARRLFHNDKIKRKNVVIMGGSSMGVWLCRTLRHRHFAVRPSAPTAPAEELADKLSHVTVIQAEPTEPSVFHEEQIAHADVFIALTEDDEHNILAAAQAKSMGVAFCMAVTQRSTYLHLLEHVGIDKAFSPRIVAARQILRLLDTGPVRVLASLEDASADVYEIAVQSGADAENTPLKKLKLPGPCLIGAVQRGDGVFVPGADDEIHAGDLLLAIGRRGMEKQLKKLFAAR